MEAVKIGIAGLGTVGGGTYAVLKRNAQELSRRAGAPIEVKTVVCRNIDRARGIVDERVTLSKDWHDLVNDPEIDIEIVEMDEEHVIGLLHLTGDEFFFQGHFPGNPIMPAVFRLEALAQAGGVALLSMPEFKGKTAVYTGIDKAKFRAMAKPGDTLRLEVHFTKRRGPMAVAEGVAWVGDQKAAEAEIKCMVIMD